MDKTSLTPLQILVTRPKPQATKLIEMLERSGARAHAIPALELSAALPTKPINFNLGYDFVIFVSPNAVDYALDYTQQQSLFIRQQTQTIAMGPGTATRMRELNLPVTLVPQSPYTSENLLALLPSAAVTGRRVLIFCGQNGRETLTENLITRGANLTIAQVYQTKLPKQGAKQLTKLLTHQQIDVITATSGSCLENLLGMAKKARPQLVSTPTVVVSERLVALAKQLGFQKILRSQNATESQICKCVWKIGRLKVQKHFEKTGNSLQNM